MIGRSLAYCRVTIVIGAGGMGEVYRAARRKDEARALLEELRARPATALTTRHEEPQPAGGGVGTAGDGCRRDRLERVRWPGGGRHCGGRRRPVPIRHTTRSAARSMRSTSSGRSLGCGVPRSER